VKGKTEGSIWGAKVNFFRKKLRCRQIFFDIRGEFLVSLCGSMQVLLPSIRLYWRKEASMQKFLKVPMGIDKDFGGHLLALFTRKLLGMSALTLIVCY
jgi:hypothetical protein